MKKFFTLINDWLNENRDYGLSLPLAYDPVTEKASVTLFMAWVSFVICAVGNILIWFKADSITAALVNILFCSLMVVFYMIRKITTARFDLQNKSFELSNEEKENK